MAVVGIDDSSLKWVGCSLCFCKSVCWMTVGCGGWWVVSSWSWLTAWCSGSARIFFLGGYSFSPPFSFPPLAFLSLHLLFPSLSLPSRPVASIVKTRRQTGRAPPSLPSPPIPFPPLEVGPLNPARGSGGSMSAPPAGSGAEPQSKSIYTMHFSVKVWHLVATILMIFLRIKIKFRAL